MADDAPDPAGKVAVASPKGSAEGLGQEAPKLDDAAGGEKPKDATGTPASAEGTTANTVGGKKPSEVVPITVKDGVWDLAGQKPEAGTTVTVLSKLDAEREGVRGDLARGLLWLLTMLIGGLLVFVGIGRVLPEVLTQSVFPSLVTLTGTALGFYFGSQSNKDSGTKT